MFAMSVCIKDAFQPRNLGDKQKSYSAGRARLLYGHVLRPLAAKLGVTRVIVPLFALLPPSRLL